MNAVAAAMADIRQHWSATARAALILGTGLGHLARHVSITAKIPFTEISGFQPTTALAHRGHLLCGTLHGVPVLLLNGRCHLYEGYSCSQLALPIRVLRACGAEVLLVTNASGGLNRQLAVGDLVVIEDHINLMGTALALPCHGAPKMRLSRSTPTPYDPQLRSQALALSRQHNFMARQGVYAAVTGPNYETRAEYRFLRRIGADVVGMSTVPEVLTAQSLGMRVLGLSVVTNMAHPDAPEVVDAGHVVSAAEQAEPHVRQILEGTLRSLASSERPAESV